MAEEWEYECPQYVDFSDPNVLDPNISVSGNYFVEDLGAQSASAEMTVAQQGEELADVESDVIMNSDSEEDISNRPEIENKIEHEQESTYQAGPSVVARNKEGNKRKALATQDINVESPYHEFRLTPIRKKYAGLYQSTYAVGQSVASDKGKENTRKLYDLRLTPARKEKAKSCHLYTSMYLKKERVSHGVRPVKTAAPKVTENLPSMSIAMIKAEPAEKKFLPYHGKGGVQRRTVATEELKGPFAKKSYVKTLGSYEEKRIMKGSQVQQEAAQEEKDVKNPVGGYFANKAIDTAGSCTTKVKPFHFRTEKRVKDSRTDEGTYKKVQFPGLLRQQATQENNSTRTVTKPKPFHFETAKRVGKTAPKGDEGAPVAKRMCLRSSVQVPPLALKEASVGTEQKKLYKPKPRELPPSCAPKPTVEPSELLASTSKPQSIPAFKAPAAQKGTKGHTVIEPFSFDQKDQQRAQLKQRKMSEAKEKPKSVFTFKAQQVPDFAGPSGIPPKAIKPSTKPAPFTFKTEKLAMEKVEKWQSGVIEELQQQRQSAMSKAQSSLGAKMPPFQPEKSEKDPKGLQAEDPAKFEQSNIRAAQKKEEDNKKEAKKGVFHRV